MKLKSNVLAELKLLGLEVTSYMGADGLWSKRNVKQIHGTTTGKRGDEKLGAVWRNEPGRLPKARPVDSVCINRARDEGMREKF